MAAKQHDGIGPDAYPAQYFCGNKRRLLDRIFAHVPEGTTRFADGCLGSGVVSWEAKRRGMATASNDIMTFPRLRAETFVASGAVRFSDGELDALCRPNPDAKRYAREWYGRAMGLEKAAWLDSLAANIARLGDPAKMRAAACCGAMAFMKPMNYGHVSFTPSRRFTGDRKLDFDLEAAFRSQAESLAKLTWDDGQEHSVTGMDVVEFAAGLDADTVCYFDPPYGGSNPYVTQMAYFDCLALVLMGQAEKITNPYNGGIPLPVSANFVNRTDGLMGLAETFVSACGVVPRVIVSYNASSRVSVDEIACLGEIHYGKMVAREEIDYSLPTNTTRCDGKGKECLLVFDAKKARKRSRGGAKPKGDRKATRPAFDPKEATFIDIFCGLGGFRIPLEASGAKCVFSSDIDRNARKVYAANFGEEPSGDITRIDASDIPPHDILCGGFPCQAWSNSVSKEAEGFKHQKGMLIWEIARIAEHHQPEVLFLENVTGILNHREGRSLETICRRLDAIGYRVFLQELNASLFGCPTARKRVYFACFRKDLGITDFEFPKPTCERVRLADVLLPDSETGGCVVDVDPHWENPPLEPDIHGRYPLRLHRLGRVEAGCQGQRIFDPNGHAATLMARSGGPGGTTELYLVNGRLRVLHPVECRRVMGFGEDFILPDGISPKALCGLFGNSVCVPVIGNVWNRIVGSLTANGKSA